MQLPSTVSCDACVAATGVNYSVLDPKFFIAGSGLNSLPITYTADIQGSVCGVGLELRTDRMVGC